MDQIDTTRTGKFSLFAMRDVSKIIECTTMFDDNSSRPINFWDAGTGPLHPHYLLRFQPISALNSAVKRSNFNSLIRLYSRNRKILIEISLPGTKWNLFKTIKRSFLRENSKSRAKYER